MNSLGGRGESAHALGSPIESAAMNSIPLVSMFPVLFFAIPSLIWYVGVLVLLFKIWQELKAIRLSR